jgi:hypothetical protein
VYKSGYLLATSKNVESELVPMKYTAKQIEEISEGSHSEIAHFITAFVVHIEKLETRVKELERQLGSNSSNSSKPPASDGSANQRASGLPAGKKVPPRGMKDIHSKWLITRMRSSGINLIFVTIANSPLSTHPLRVINAGR